MLLCCARKANLFVHVFLTLVRVWTDLPFWGRGGKNCEQTVRKNNGSGEVTAWPFPLPHPSFCLLHLPFFPFFPIKELGARSTLLRLVGILLGKTVIRSGYALLFAIFLRSWNLSLHQLNSEKIMVQFCYLRALSFCQNWPARPFPLRR